MEATAAHYLIAVVPRTFSKIVQGLYREAIPRQCERLADTSQIDERGLAVFKCNPGPLLNTFRQTLHVVVKEALAIGRLLTVR